MRHVFAAGTLLAGHAAVVVHGRTASTGSLSLTNAGDTVTLANAQGTVDRVSYTSALASVDAVSMNRKPDGDPAGSFVLHTTLSSQSSSPGTRVDGSGFGAGTAPPPPPAITAETEPNDVPGSASGPVGSAAVAASIASSTDVDWYRFSTAGGTVTISVTAVGAADLDWFLYKDGDPTTVVARGYTVSNPETGSYSAGAGSYLLLVNGYRGVTAPYNLQVVAP